MARHIHTRRFPEDEAASLSEGVETQSMASPARATRRTSSGATMNQEAGDFDDTVADAGIGGSSPFTGEDVIDETGRAVGVGYDDGEPLEFGSKETTRDDRRWELDPASSEDYEERQIQTVSADRAKRRPPILNTDRTRKQPSLSRGNVGSSGPCQTVQRGSGNR